MRRLVVRLRDSIADKENTRAVRRPAYVALVEGAPGYLLRLRFLTGDCGHAHGPDVPVSFRIQIARAVRAIHSFGDHAHVADVFGRFVLAAARGTDRLGLFRIGFLFLLAGVFATYKSDRLAVRRPLERAGAARRVGELLRFTAIERQQPNLRRLRLTVPFTRANEGEHLAIGRPQRPCVARTAGKLSRSA